MKRSMMNPALVAGLGGASLALAPNIAFGLTAQGLADAFFTSPIAPFAVGVLGAAAVAGTVYNLVVKYAELKESGSDLSFSFIAPRRHAKKTSRPSHAMHAAEAPVAASLYKARHMSPADFEKSGVIRIQPAQDYAELRNAANDSRKKRTQKHLKTSFMETIDNVMMNGVPVIERADGTVGDVGTGWWSRGIGDKSISSDNALAGEAPVDAFLHNRNRLTPQNITHRVAQIDEGLYPEKRTADDLDKSDMWTSALEALDEKLGNTHQQNAYPVPAFIDVIGGSETIDEPEGMEPTTGFIVLSSRARRAEDSADISKSSSLSLRIIEGGTHGMRIPRPASRTKSTYVGKHFASMPIAAEV